MPVSGRRTFLAATLALAACPLAGRAQGPEKVRRVGFLANTIALAELDQGTSTNPAFVEFVAGLRKLGWQEGRNIRIVWRSAENQLGRLPQLARELVSASVEVIVAFGPGADAAARATKEIPIVMATYYSPVEAGLARSLAKPGGNVTGILLAAGNEQSIQKRLALLKEAAPGIARIGWLGWNPRKQAQRWVERVKADPAFASAAAHLGVSVFGDSFETAEDVPGAMERAVREEPRGWSCPTPPFFTIGSTRSGLPARPSGIAFRSCTTSSLPRRAAASWPSGATSR
jgi:putative ABC transport system substrate-binding protein